jgi:CRISPR-associated protein Cmr6
MSSLLIPLYKGGNLDLERCPSDANAGLWYDKFCNQWDNNWSLGDNGKKKWLQSVQNGRVGDKDLLEEVLKRYIRLVKYLGGEVRFFRNITPFVTGLGRTHPTENGFTWHYNLGTPYLPGSSVKGIVRSWAESWWNGEENDDKNELVRQVFGPENENQKTVGSLIFFDALPVEPVRLETDVMTPHYAPYYLDGQNVPGDWYNPIPIPFLTTVPGQLFIFAVAPRRQEQPGNLELAMNWLTESLGLTGGGAKTAVGYGCFELVPDTAAKYVPREYLAAAVPKDDAKKTSTSQEPERELTPIQQEMEEDGYSTDASTFMEALTVKWLGRMEADETAASERKEIAGLLADWYKKNRAKQWKKPTKKNIDKVERIKNLLESTNET